MQPPTEEELSIAYGRAFGEEENDPFAEVNWIIKQKGYPAVACIGSSHVTHWAQFRRSKFTKDIDRQRLARFRFAGVGGTKLINMIRQIGGLDLPPRKRHLGDQWAKLAVHKHKIQYAILAIGSNDVDDCDRYLKARYIKDAASKEHKKETSAALAQWYKDLVGHQKLIIEKIRSIFKRVRIYYLPILPRGWWCLRARKLAILLNRSMDHMENIRALNTKDLYNIKAVNNTKKRGIKEETINGVLDWDKTHLNEIGYHILTKKTALTLLQHQYDNLRPATAAKTPSLHQQPTNQEASKTPKEKVSRRHKRTMSKLRRAKELNE